MSEVRWLLMIQLNLYKEVRVDSPHPWGPEEAPSLGQATLDRPFQGGLCGAWGFHWAQASGFHRMQHSL